MTVGLGSVFSLFGLDGPGFRDSFLLGVCCFVAAGLSCLVAARLVEGLGVFLPSLLLDLGDLSFGLDGVLDEVFSSCT